MCLTLTAGLNLCLLSTSVTGACTGSRAAEFVFVDLHGIFEWKVVGCRRRFSETKKLTAEIPV